MKINYKTKITVDRKFYVIDDISNSIESDRGRIISSAAFRRLQNRTQVWSLELNSAIRTRLTHSLEVGQTARYIAKTILKKIQVNGLEDQFISIVEIASLLHDIGNPPFGHFAETTFDEWMSKNIEGIFSNVSTKTDEERAFKKLLIDDLSSFDGNAQAIRIIDKLQRYNLSYSQAGAVLKYTRGAFEKKPTKDDSLSYLKKKTGYYYSEKDYVETLCKTLEMKKGHRFPLTYVMEAADDISYLTADLEDAVDKGIFDIHELYELILKEDALVNKDNDNDYFEEIVTRVYKYAIRDEEAYQFDMFLTLLRARLIGDLVRYVSDVYVDNHEEIFNGSFNHALLEHDKNSKYLLASDVLRNIAIKHIYKHPSIEKLQIYMYKIINDLLNSYKSILLLSTKDMNKLVNAQSIENEQTMEIFNKLSTKHIVVYKESVEAINTDETMANKSSLELYYRVRLILDYISGMTDDFALHEYENL